MSRPCIYAHPAPDPDNCGLCRLYVHREEYRNLWGPDEPGGHLILLPPCPHEGPVVDPAACNCEARHVRLCLHETLDHVGDRCTRGQNSGVDPGIASCVTCKYNPSNPTTHNV